ncbi:MAG: hypothetical protein WBQ94_02800 [Terracidiphilus sp.]
MNSPLFRVTLFASSTFGLGHGVSLRIVSQNLFVPGWCDLWKDNAVGVGHEINSLSDVRCAEATSWYSRRPDGVTDFFQFSRNNVEPSASVFFRNLLAKDNDRAMLFNEPEP